MYFIATKFKNNDKAQLNGPFEVHNLAEQGLVNLLARSDVESATIVDEEELEDPEKSDNEE